MELSEKINKVLEELRSDVRVEGREVGKYISVNVVGKEIYDDFLVSKESSVFIYDDKCIVSHDGAENIESVDILNDQLIQVGLDRSDSNYERLNWKVFEDFEG